MIRLEDVVKLSLERLAPSQTTMFERPLTNLMLSSREGITVQSLTDASGRPLAMVGVTKVGDGSVVG